MSADNALPQQQQQQQQWQQDLEQHPGNSQLLALPPQIFAAIWEQLATARRSPSASPSAPPDQLALRCCCRAAKDASNSHISQLAIQLDLPALQQRRRQQQKRTGSSRSGSAARDAAGLVLQHAKRQLFSFPAAAQLQHLSISYTHCQPNSDRDRVKAVYPNLFLSMLTSRDVSTVTHLTLHGHMAITDDDMDCIVEACPRLQSLTLRSVPIIPQPHGSTPTSPTPAFAALSRLQHLRRLEVRGAWHPHGGQAELGAGLCRLPQLQELTVISDWASHRDPGYPGMGFSDILPHLPGLPALRSLSLSLHLDTYPGNDERWDFRAFTVFSSLTQLTHLHLEAIEDQWDDALSCQDICFPASLVSISTLMDLDPSAVRALAQLPRLQDVTARSLPLAPDCDLSGGGPGGGWRKLALGFCTLSELSRLPLRGCTQLRVSGEELLCKLGPSAELQATADMLAKAACILAGVQGGVDDRGCTRICFRRDRQAGPPPPGFPHHLLLASLAPLCGFECLGLAFDESWDLGEQLVQQLEQQLPLLEALHLRPRSPNFQYILTALAAARLPRVRKLVVYDMELDLLYDSALLSVIAPFPHQAQPQLRETIISKVQPAQDALFQMAQARAASGLPLHILSSCVMDAARFNDMLAAVPGGAAVTFKLVRGGVDEW